MCGIAGYQSTKQPGEADSRLAIAMPLLGVFMESRGTQSWGWTNGEKIVKNVGAFQSGFDSSMLGYDSSLIHTRLATFGQKTAENSHPFSIKGIIGVHNGMIYNHKEIAEKYGIEYNVDSEIIFHAIADGIPMNELHGYGTIVFYRDGLLHMGRFSNRGDLSLAKTSAGWLFASEKRAVLNSAAMSGLEVEHFIDTELGKLYVIHGDEIFETNQDMTLGEYTPVKGPSSWQDFQGKGYSSYSGGVSRRGVWGDDGDFLGYGGGSGGWYGHHRQNVLPLPTAETTTFTAEPESDADEVIDVSDGDYIDGGFGTLTPLAEAMHVMGDDIDELEFTPENFRQTTADRHFERGFGQCEDCFEEMEGDELVFVQRHFQQAFCAYCYERNYEVLDSNNVSDTLTISEWERELEEEAKHFQDNINFAATGYENFVN